MKTCFNAFLVLLTLTLTLVIAPASYASLMVLDMTGGSLDGATLLNGNALGVTGQDFDFTLHVVFDSTPITTIGTSFAWFAATTSLTLKTFSGDVTLHGTVPVSLGAMVLGPTTLYAAAIAPNGDFQNNYISGISSAPTPVFDPLNPTPTVLVSDTTYAQGTLVFGGDTLSNLGGGTKGLTAQVSNASAVPEPSTYALLCISLGVVGYARRKMKMEK